jgi:hypothetical protein
MQYALHVNGFCFMAKALMIQEQVPARARASLLRVLQDIQDMGIKVALRPEHGAEFLITRKVAR